MEEVKMVKVIMELGEFGKLWQEYNILEWELKREREAKKILQEKLNRLEHKSGEWIVFTPDAIDHEHAKFGSFQDAKTRAVEISEKTGLVTKIAEIKETVTKGEEF